MNIYKAIACFLLIPSCCFAQRESLSHVHEHPEHYKPRFSGMPLSPYPVTTEPRHPVIQPFIFLFDIYGEYNDDWGIDHNDTIWAVNPILNYSFGLTDKIEIEVVGSYIFNYQNGKQFDHFQDTLLDIGYQFTRDIKGSWVPDFSISLLILFPSGNFHQLDPDLFGLDQTGQGAIQTGFELAFQKLFYLPKNFFMFHWTFTYLYPQEATVKDFNAYGGGIGTRGKIRPGQTFIGSLGGEYSLSTEWVIGLDSLVLYQTKTSEFKGKLGKTLSGEGANVALPSKMQISINPFVEYNFSSNAGFLTGAWLTLAGRNTSAFASLFFSFIYVF